MPHDEFAFAMFARCSLSLSVVAYLLLKLHLMFNIEAASLTRLPAWLGSFYNFDASVSYSNLWTMPIEFQGSMLVFSIVAVFVTPRFLPAASFLLSCSRPSTADSFHRRYRAF
jgi:hypothetical protein